MKIPVLGLDPSFRNWGFAEGILDLETGELSDLNLILVETDTDDTKQVRQNSKDLARATVLAKTVFETASKAKLIFVEVPVGSQSANAMKSYGVCVGILGAIRSQGAQLIEVSPTEVKKAFTGNGTATKKEMINTAVTLYPNANFPRERNKPAGRVLDKAEHVADAIATIYAGVQTPAFQSLMRILAGV